MDRNVVLVILDTVRKDYFDKYGKRISEKSDLTFSQCRSASSWSVPSHASIFSQQNPSEHGINAENFDMNNNFGRLEGRNFLDSLSEHHTIGISSNPYVNSMYDFDLIFDNFNDFITHESLFNSGISPYTILNNYEGDKLGKLIKMVKESYKHDNTLKSTINCIWHVLDFDLSDIPMPGLFDKGASTITDFAVERSSKNEPFFMFINYMDAHTPLKNIRKYDQNLHSVPNKWNSDEFHNWELNKEGMGNEKYADNYRQLYGAAVEYLDRKIYSLIERINKNTENETTFIITADHGHNLGYPEEDGYFHHAGNLSEGLLHVPLEVVNPPKNYPTELDGFFSHLDLGKFILDVANEREFDHNLISEEIVAETIGLTGTGDPRDYREFSSEEWLYWNRMIRCVYKGNNKIIWDSNGGKEVYKLNKKRSCWQEIDNNYNLEKEELETLENKHFREEIKKYKNRIKSRNSNTEDQAIKKRLEKLGYI